VVAVREVAQSLDHDQRRELYRWARELQSVRLSGRRRVAKALAAVKLTTRREVLAPILEEIKKRLIRAGVKSRKLLWDNRNWASRMALGGVAVAGAAGAKVAGIAAFGGAIGVPLWLLTSSGGGGAFPRGGG
jgi:hypothetical protein